MNALMAGSLDWAYGLAALAAMCFFVWFVLTAATLIEFTRRYQTWKARDEEENDEL